VRYRGDTEYPSSSLRKGDKGNNNVCKLLIRELHSTRTEEGVCVSRSLYCSLPFPMIWNSRTLRRCSQPCHALIIHAPQGARLPPIRTAKGLVNVQGSTDSESKCCQRSTKHTLLPLKLYATTKRQNSVETSCHHVIYI